MDFLKDIKPRDYQKEIFEKCKEKNCLVVLPTGLGKTLIALMLCIERLQKFPGSKNLILAPTKPLAEQHLNFFKKHLPELFADSQLFTGAINSEKRAKIWDSADIIFSTPQCIANDIRKRLYNLENVSLLVQDEAHRCIKNYDYNYVAKKYKEQAKDKRIVGLTASPGNDIKKIKEICKNLSIEEVELRTRDSIDVKKNIQKLNFEKIIVDLPPEFEEIKQLLKKMLEGYINELKSRNLLFSQANKVTLIELQKRMFNQIRANKKNFNVLRGISVCANALKLQHALELIETQTIKGFNEYLKELQNQSENAKSKGVQQLVKKPHFILAFKKSEEILSKKEEHPKIRKALEIVSSEIEKNKKAKIIVFTNFRETARIIVKQLNLVKGINSRVFVGQLKKNEIGLSQKEQRETIEKFSEGKINVLCATSIGEEGLDIPEVNLVIFYEPVPSAIRAIQRTGRTARLKEGKLIVLITKNTKDETSYYVSRRREKGMSSAIDSVKKELKYNGKIESQSILDGY